jgi:hypothetical protein
MNDRIRLLAEQAGIELPDSSAYNGHIYRNSIEKFAELIVRECAEVCMKEIDTGWVMAPKSPWMAKQILEHFGVEE